MTADQQADAVPHDGRDETQNERMDRDWNELLQELRVTQTGTQILSGFPAHPGVQPRFASLDELQLTLYVALVLLAATTSGPGQPAPGALPPTAEAVDRQIRPPLTSTSARRRCPHRGWHCAADPRRRRWPPSRSGRRGRHLLAGRGSCQLSALLPPFTPQGARAEPTLRSVTPTSPGIGHRGDQIADCPGEWRRPPWGRSPSK